MTSADPTVTDPMNPQGWNRYSYVGNDPLAFTDPNGFSWLSSFFHSVVNFFVSNPIVRAIVQIAVATVLIVSGVGAVIAAAASSSLITGLSGGNLGQILRAGLIAGATAYASAFFPATNALAHAAIGCASSAASGGSCASGAASGATGSLLSPVTSTLFPNAASDPGQLIGGTLVQATAGGLASIAGGGKFENGATTAAFQYLISTGSGSGSGIGSGAGLRDPMNANASELYPFQQGVETQGYSGQGPNIIGSLGQAWAGFMSIALPSLAPELVGARVASRVGVEIDFQSLHGGRHLEGLGLSIPDVEGAIRSEISSQSGVSTQFVGAFYGRVSVQGQMIEYRGFGLENGRVNVGTYYPK